MKDLVGFLLLVAMLGYFLVMPAIFLICAIKFKLIHSILLFISLSAIFLVIYLCWGGGGFLLMCFVNLVCGFAGFGYWLKYEKNLDWL